ncbi:dTDP-4-dehydrorhamnose reductase [Cupriavidus necator]|uniref:dTDP-4-dehydrorhamnose reductase n=1 Tax=Cupriavidus necator (strain ATCC 17699 / DSM 428 / KCTC 22496 / NCIMB 10442 / H16 / Stanier 337) TaxID=381666 RepID=Q0K7N7_CUPNH|nr:dTDP-4-dehydrorhamnose reductase [Cupriavidus necator]QCC01753.1 dTDP-4-dehydrorhamnose reductase [Cupriavidus necator H16]QQB75417.1 dTDP-4-dehydrorhamnose reductase [Cupriavidus necator]WKA40152.1 dTDP-4-dehydrorhamnose reductase [Cupriavidus necator]CAJ93984.1 dTDP-4-dehydrorhamnose reductase [Cupriavidus necator H16]
MSRSQEFPTILLTGSNGQVGFELRRSLAPLGRIVALDRSACDLADPAQIRRAIRQSRPDAIVNAAAYTAVDKAETEADLAFAINATAVAVMAEEARRLGTLLVHYSTDYVFDGRKDGLYLETDPVNPLSEYGKSKVAGEESILAAGVASLILRTSWVAGAHGKNFATTILGLARERRELRVAADQHGAPTSASLIADVTAQILARHWLFSNRDTFPAGIYHLAASGETTWHAYATEVLRHAASHGVVLKIRPEDIQGIPAAEYYSAAAPRPANSRLDTTKLRKTFGIHLPSWEEGVRHLLDQILTKRALHA